MRYSLRPGGGRSAAWSIAHSCGRSASHSATPALTSSTRPSSAAGRERRATWGSTRSGWRSPPSSSICVAKRPAPGRKLTQMGRPLDPALLGRHEHCLRAVQGAQLAVNVVQVAADGARGEVELRGDLLVDLALRETPEDVQLSRGERTRAGCPATCPLALGKLVEDMAHRQLVQAAVIGGLDQVPGADRAVLDVGGDHVGDSDHGTHSLRLAGVVALDRLRDAGVDAPAPGEDAADESVVDAELAALLGDPVIGGCAPPVEALGVAGM